jgi:hypothetical protein
MTMLAAGLWLTALVLEFTPNLLFSNLIFFAFGAPLLIPFVHVEIERRAARRRE